MSAKRHVRIGVPPGVGDVYWALCKLGSFREKNRLERVELVIKSSQYDRAGAWAEMCPFVDSTDFADFRSEHAEKEGVAIGVRPNPRPDGSVPLPIDLVMWPNAVVDTGAHLSTWMPQYEIDQGWKIKTVQPRDPLRNVDDETWMTKVIGRPVVYASSKAVNSSWAPRLGSVWWGLLLANIEKQFGVPPVLIGAGWDTEFRLGIRGPCIDMVGKTTLPEVAWILEHATAVVGIISGMTILANHFQRPTIAIYPRKHHPLFPESWIPPGAPFLNYRADSVPSPVNVALQLRELSR